MHRQNQSHRINVLPIDHVYTRESVITLALDGNYHKANLWITVQKNNQGTIVATVSQSNYTNIPNGSSYTVQGCRKGRFNKCIHAAETLYFKANF